MTLRADPAGRAERDRGRRHRPAGRARRRRCSGSASTAVTVWDIAKWPVIVVDRDHDARDALLRGAQRPPARASAGSPPAASLAVVLWIARLGGLRALRRQLRLLQQDLRQPGRGDRLPGLAVDLEPRGAARGRAQRRAERGREVESGVPRSRRSPSSRAARPSEPDATKRQEQARSRATPVGRGRDLARPRPSLL